MRDVAFSCDNNGADFLRVTVWSLLEHYRGAEPLRINVFTGFGGHSPENQAKLRQIVEAQSRRHSPNSTSDPGFFTLRYHDVEPWVRPHADLIMNRARSRWNVFTWTPIFTPAILADAEGNVAHFDIDMLFNDDVSKLLDLELGDKLIASVAEYAYGDPVITEAVWGKGILPKSVRRYFNTGTLVFNTAKCREERTWGKLLDWYREHYDIADRIEQDAWNALYHERTFLLPLRWNFHDRLIKRFARADIHDEYWQGNPPHESLEAALKPAILHFWGPKKPWKPCHRPYRKLYHRAMAAVGMAVPRESAIAFIHDWRNRHDLKLVADKLRDLDDPPWRSWRRHCLVKRLKRTALAPFEWLGIGMGLLVLSALPHRALLTLCDALSAVYYRCDRRGRRRALENLHIIRGTCTGDEGTPAFDPDRAAFVPTRREELVLRRSYRNMARTIGHIFWTCCKAKARVAAVGEMDAPAKEFLRTNHPAVTVSAHLGCWEILSQLALLQGHSMMSVAKRIGTGGMTRMLMRARKSIGQEIVAADGAFKPLMSGLKAGKSLGLLVDQSVEPKHGGIFVRFFGRPISVSAAPAFFAAKAKAAIIVAWSRPLKDGRYRCECLKTYAPAAARDVWGLTQRIATDLERIIRRHPSCWVLNYNFFSNYPSSADLATLEKREANSGVTA